MKKLLLCLLYKINSMNYDVEKKMTQEDYQLIEKKEQDIQKIIDRISHQFQQVRSFIIETQKLFKEKNITCENFIKLFIWRFDREKKEKINILQKRLIEITKKTYEEIKQVELKENNDFPKTMKRIHEEFQIINIEKIMIIRESNIILYTINNITINNMDEFHIENLIDVIGKENLEIISLYIKNKKIITSKDASLIKFHKILKEKIDIIGIYLESERIMNKVIKYLTEQKENINGLKKENLLESLSKDNIADKFCYEYQKLLYDNQELFNEQNKFIKENQKKIGIQLNTLNETITTFIRTSLKIAEEKEFKIIALLRMIRSSEMIRSSDSSLILMNLSGYLGEKFYEKNYYYSDIEEIQKDIKFIKRIINIILEENTKIKELKVAGKTSKDIDNYLEEVFKKIIEEKAIIYKPLVGNSKDLNAKLKEGNIIVYINHLSEKIERLKDIEKILKEDQITSKSVEKEFRYIDKKLQVLTQNMNNDIEEFFKEKQKIDKVFIQWEQKLQYINRKINRKLKKETKKNHLYLKKKIIEDEMFIQKEKKLKYIYKKLKEETKKNYLYLNEILEEIKQILENEKIIKEKICTYINETLKKKKTKNIYIDEIEKILEKDKNFRSLYFYIDQIQKDIEKSIEKTIKAKELIKSLQYNDEKLIDREKINEIFIYVYKYKIPEDIKKNREKIIMKNREKIIMIIKELYEGIYKNLIEHTNYIDKLSEEIHISKDIKKILEENKQIISNLSKLQDIKLEKEINTYLRSLLSSKNLYSKFNQIDIFDNVENFSDIKTLMYQYMEQTYNDNVNMKTNINIEELPKKNKQQVEFLLIQKETERIINKIIKYLHGIEEILNHNNIKSFLKELEYLSNENDNLSHQKEEVKNLLSLKYLELKDLINLDIIIEKEVQKFTFEIFNKVVPNLSCYSKFC